MTRVGGNVQSTVMKLLICHWIIEHMTMNQSLQQYMIWITYTLCKRYCMYVYTYTLISQVKRRDNFHYVSKSIDCKLCNDLQYLDIVFIICCFYQVDRVHNTQFIVMSAFLTLLMSDYMFSIHDMLPILQYCAMHLMVKW